MVESRRVLVLGATGRTGRPLVRRALEEGCAVTAFVRDRSSLGPAEGQRIVVGDVMSVEDVRAAAEGQEAVLNAIGSRQIRHPIEVATTKVLLAACADADVRRLVVCSAFGVGATRRDAAPLSRFFFRTVLGKVYAQKEVADAMVRDSGLDWTLVYPTRLTDDPPRGDFQAVERLPRDGVPRISREDVAQFMLDQLSSDTWLKRTVVVSNHP